VRNIYSSSTRFPPKLIPASTRNHPPAMSNYHVCGHARVAQLQESTSRWVSKDDNQVMVGTTTLSWMARLWSLSS
jgi:hypothetical protein